MLGDTKKTKEGRRKRGERYFSIPQERTLTWGANWESPQSRRVSEHMRPLGIKRGFFESRLKD